MCFFSSWLILLASLNRRATLYRSVLPDSRSPLRRVMDIISDLRCFTSSILCAAFCFSVSKNSKSLDPLAESGWLATYVTQTNFCSPTSIYINHFFLGLHTLDSTGLTFSAALASSCCLFRPARTSCSKSWKKN